MTAREQPAGPLNPVWAGVMGIHLAWTLVVHAPAFSELLNGVSLHLHQQLSGRYRPDVRWIEGYNAWCGQWAAAQSRPGPPIA